MSARQRTMQTLRLLGTPLLLGAVVGWVGPQAIWAALQVADAAWLLAGLCCAIAGNATAALRWAELARWLGHRVTARWALTVYFKASAINALLPGAVIGGDLFRAWQLHRNGLPRAAAGLSVVFDRLSGLWILFALGALALLGGLGTPDIDTLRRLLPLPVPWPTPVIAVGALLLVLLLPLGALRVFAVLAGRGAHAQDSRRMAVATLLRRPEALRQYVWQAAASLVVALFTVGSLYCAARAFDIVLPTWLVAVTAAPIFLFASLPVSFGGWGTREAATVAAWAAFGVAPPSAVAAAAAVGVYALLQAVLGLLPTPTAVR